jgi:hypothetical protein
MTQPSPGQDEAAPATERLAVMISSTSLDLPRHRAAVSEAILRVGWYPLAMEHGSAEPGSNALSYSWRLVDQADLFVGIIAFRYGYMPADPATNPDGWSVTEHEYRRAIQRGIPVLIFLMHDDHPDARQGVEAAAPAQQKLQALRAELKTKHICGFFRSVDELQARVLQSLYDVKLSLLQRPGRCRSAGPFQSPPLPGHYVHRPQEEQRLQDDLLRQDAGPGVVVSAVFGLGGIGKSTLAAAVVQSRPVRERFADGVLWVTLGQAPDLQPLLGQWLRDLGDHEFRAIDIRSASGRLRQLLQERAVLLVVDDAWNSEHVEPFQVGGPRCRLLVTTRRRHIADDLHATSHELDVLSPEQALELLATHLHRPLRDDERGPARRLAEAVGRLPLALELAAVRVGRRVPWDELLRKLEQEAAALEALEDPAERWKKKGKIQLEASLQLSLRALRDENEEAYRCFVWLGVLPDDATVAGPMASALWDFEHEAEADGLLEFLWGEALLQPAVAVQFGGKAWRAYRVHDLLHDCARRLLEAPETPRRQGELPGLGLTRPEAHRQLLGRYRKRTRDGLWHTLTADGYVHGRLGWHLEKAGDVDGLHALLREETAEGRNGWYEANERLGQPSHFADCVAQAWRLADQAFAEGRPALGLQCRYALVTASLNSLAGNLSSVLLVVQVGQGLWPVEQALASARRIPEAHGKILALTALFPFLSVGERAAALAEASAAARAIGHEQLRLFWLGELARRLAEPERAVALAEVVAAARASHSPWTRFDVLKALLPHFEEPERAAMLAEALSAARAIVQRVSGSKKELAALVPHLAEPERSAVLAEALSGARASRDQVEGSVALAALAPSLAESERFAELAETLTGAKALKNEGHRAWALAALAPHLPAGLLAEALAVARALEAQVARSLALRALTPHLAEPERAAVLAEALAAARAIRQQQPRSQALTALAPHLAEPEQSVVYTEALTAARAIGDQKACFLALAGLAPQQAEQEGASLLAEALAAARAGSGEVGSSQASLALTDLTALAPHLAGQERIAVLAEALAAARTIRDEASRWLELDGLVPHLPAELLPEALAAARTFRDHWNRSQMLAQLAPRLAEQERAAVLGEALSASRAIGNDARCSWMLTRLAPQLPADLLGEALEAARSIENEEHRSEPLTALVPRLPEHERAGVLSEALAAARSIKDEKHRSEALRELVPHLPEGARAAVLAEALTAARCIGHEWRRCWVLAALAPHLSGSLLTEALVATRTIGDHGARSPALAALAQRLPEPERAAVLAEALTAARAIGEEFSLYKVLTALAPQLPESLLREALTVARAMAFPSRNHVLAALAPRLACLAGPTRSSLWMQSLPLLAARTRQDLVADLRSLAPVLTALAGPNGPTELREVARAIADVTRWWP